MDREPGLPLFSPREADTRAPRKGTRYRIDSYGHAIARACLRAGVAHWFPHQLRHNAATRLVAEFGWEIARIVLGHRQVQTTQIYAMDGYAKAIEAMGKVG